MKILLLSFYYYPDLCAGSFRCSSLVEQLKLLSGPNVMFDIITTRPNRYSSFNADAPDFEQNSGLTIHRIPVPQHKSGMIDQAKAFLHYANEVRKIVKSEQYDLVFATSSRLMTAALGAWIARRMKAKLYLDIRDIFVDTINDVLPKKISFFTTPFFSFLEKWALNRADKINLVSEGFKSYFNLRYPLKRFSWYTNGIDNEFIVLDNKKQSIHQPSSSLNILYAGNIGLGQGLHNIIPFLAKKMQGKVNFKIIGDGGRKDLLCAELSNLGCDNVEIFSPVDRNELITEYSKADVLFLHLNDYDAFKKVLPSKIFEYAAVGKPILAGVSGYSAEFITTEVSNAVVFSPGDVDEAEEALKKLTLGFEDRSNFIDKFSRQKIMKNFAQDILSLAGI